MKAPRICGCGYRIAADQACPCERTRAQERKARHDERRPSARQRGYTAEWQREARAFLARPENHYCVCGCGRRADTVDHIKPHRGDRALFWDRANWQPMAFGCHSSKKQRSERSSAKGKTDAFASVSRLSP
jgi:5-methylcytosine-specific restriction endonuclease McrA